MDFLFVWNAKLPSESPQKSPTVAVIDAYRINYELGVYKRIMGLDWGVIYPLVYRCIDMDDGIDAETTGY